MITVSSDFQTAVKAATRRWVPRLEITWVDSSVDPTTVVTVTDENRVSYKTQVTDLIKEPSRKWAHIDGTLKPNGTFYPAPAIAASGQMGWWGATRCSGLSTWTAGSYPSLTMTFATRPVLGFGVVGDDEYNEYPVDFDVEFYNPASTLLHTETITGNTDLDRFQTITGEILVDVAKLKLIIKKWSSASRVVKILEIYMSVIETYEGNDIVKMSLLEEREIADGSLPVGNISANELDIELQNISIVKNGDTIYDPFSYDNASSYLQNVLKKNRKIVASIGLYLSTGAIEWLSLGTFWSGDWNASEKSATVTTSARDRLELLRKVDFKKSVIDENISLYRLAEIMLALAKVDIPMYDLVSYIDPELDDYTVSYAYFKRQSYFQCLKEIATACQGQVYMSRGDVVTITGPSFAGESTTYSITSDDYFDRQQPARSEQIVNKVLVPIAALTPDSATSEVYRSDNPVAIHPGTPITITAEYKDVPVKNGTLATGLASLEDETAGVSISSATYYAWGAEVTVQNAGGSDGVFTLVIEGIVYRENSDEVVIAEDTTSQAEYGILKYDFPKNHLIQSRETGELIGDTLLESYKDLRKDTLLDWRGDPSVVLGDVVTVPIYQRDTVDVKGRFCVFKNELDFDGTVRAKTEARFISNVVNTFQDKTDSESVLLWQDKTDSDVTLYQDKTNV